MTREQKLIEKNKLLDVISYSRRNKGHLTTAEIILLHQYMQRGLELSNKVKQKINRVKTIIELENWKRPITRFNSEIQIEQLNQDTGSWQIVK